MEYIRAELKPQRITGSSATVVSSGRSFLGSIWLNGLNGSLYIYDMAAITSPGFGITASAIAVVSSSTIVLAHDYNYVMANGIIIVSSVAGNDFTVASANN